MKIVAKSAYRSNGICLSMVDKFRPVVNTPSEMSNLVKENSVQGSKACDL